MVNGAPQEVPQVLMESLGRILKVPLRISLGLCPREITQGTFNILPWDFISTLRNFPRGSIHHDTPLAWSQCRCSGWYMAFRTTLVQCVYKVQCNSMQFGSVQCSVLSAVCSVQCAVSSVQHAVCSMTAQKYCLNQYLDQYLKLILEVKRSI